MFKRKRKQEDLQTGNVLGHKEITPANQTR